MDSLPPRTHPLLIIIGIVVIGIAAFTFLYLKKSSFVRLVSPSTSSSSKAPITEPLIIQDQSCKGNPIRVIYTLSGSSAKTPFECKPYCDTRKDQPRFILYTNGFGTQCGINYCQDGGEDKCVTCQVPKETLGTYGLPTPRGPAPCKHQ